MSDELPRRRKRKSKRPPQLRVPHHEIVAAEVAEKQREALDLRKLGLTYEAIAKRMNCSAMSAHRYVNKAIAAIPKEAAEDTKRVMLETCYANLVQINTRIQAGLTPEQAFKAIGAMVKVRDQIAKYEGHYAPTRAELTGRDGSPLTMTVTDLEGMNDDQLDRIIRMAIGRGASGGSGGAETEASPGEGRATRRTH